MKTKFLAAAILSLCLAGGCEKPSHGKVVQRVYTPSSTGIGSGISSKGTPVTVTTYTAEKFTLVIQNDDGSTSTRTVSGETYVKFKEGDRWDDDR